MTNRTVIWIAGTYLAVTLFGMNVVHAKTTASDESSTAPPEVRLWFTVPFGQQDLYYTSAGVTWSPLHASLVGLAGSFVVDRRWLLEMGVDLWMLGVAVVPADADGSIAFGSRFQLVGATERTRGFSLETAAMLEYRHLFRTTLQDTVTRYETLGLAGAKTYLAGHWRRQNGIDFLCRVLGGIYYPVYRLGGADFDVFDDDYRWGLRIGVQVGMGF